MLSETDWSESLERSVVSSSSDDDVMVVQLSQEVSEGDLGGVTEEHSDTGVQGGWRVRVGTEGGVSDSEREIVSPFRAVGTASTGL